MPAITVINTPSPAPSLRAIPQGHRKTSGPRAGQSKRYSRRGQSGLRQWAKKVQMALRLSLIAILLALMLWAGVSLSMAGWHWWTGDISHLPEQDPNVWVWDSSGQLPEETRASFNTRLASMSHAFQADWRLVVVNQASREALHQKAEELLTQWQVGRATLDKRGGVILLTEAPVKVAIAVTPSLEKVMGPQIQHMGFAHLSDLLEVYPWDQQLERGGLSLGLHQFLSLVEQGSGVKTLIARSSPFEMPTDLQALLQEPEATTATSASQGESTTVRHAKMSLPPLEDGDAPADSLEALNEGAEAGRASVQ